MSAFLRNKYFCTNIFLFFSLIFFSFAQTVSAVITINEVAWMGSLSSANDEWIELYNTGTESVSLEGWTLTDGMNLNIEFSGVGSIAPDSFAVLERTDDDSSSASAFLIYTGALVNTGATLVLSRADGYVEDQIVGGENWENIGGDNTTKETAQYTASGWVTSEATPGSSNSIKDVIIENPVDINESGEGEKNVRQNSGSATTQLELPDVSLQLSIVSPDIVYVHQEVSFDVEPSGLGKVVMNSLKYKWNFGDLSTSPKKEVKHTFSYPGEYVVTIYATYPSYEQISRKKIIVLPVSFSITQNIYGDVQIHNNSKYEVNISGYTVVGSKEITFPENSILLPNATITVPKEKLGGTFKYIKLLNQRSILVASLNSEAKTEILIQEQYSESTEYSPVQVGVQKVNTYNNFTFEEEGSVDSTTDKESISYEWDDNQPVVTTVSELEEKFPKGYLPILGLIGVIFIGILSIFVGKRKRHN